MPSQIKALREISSLSKVGALRVESRDMISIDFYSVIRGLELDQRAAMHTITP
jgi:hypothetical protein